MAYRHTLAIQLFKLLTQRPGINDDAIPDRDWALTLFIVLGPVNPTASHRQANPMGWQTFRQLAAPVAVPVYALGGMNPGLLAIARQHGAHGIALLSGAW